MRSRTASSEPQGRSSRVSSSLSRLFIADTTLFGILRWALLGGERWDCRSFVPTTPNRHFRAAVSGPRISSVNHLVNRGTIEAPVIALRQQGQIRWFGFKFSAQGPRALGVSAMAPGAIFHVCRLAFVGVLRQRTADRSQQKGCGAQHY